GDSLNGYDSLIFERYRDLLTTGYGQSLRLDSLLTRAPLLDLLGVRYILAQDEPPRTPSALDPGPLRGTFQLPLDPGASARAQTEGVAADALEVVSWLGNSAGLEQGVAVATVRVVAPSGESVERSLRAGIETAEWAWDRPDLRGTVRHARAPVAFDLEGD